MMSLLLTSPLFTAESQKKEIKHTELHYTSPFKKIKEFNKNVFLVSDSCEKNFIIKQHMTPAAVIREVIASEIGENIVNINKVQIISHSSLKGIEFNSNMLYTLHEYISGEYDGYVFIKKAINNETHLIEISQNDKTLAQIVAFNMYINNFDCHESNLFKNETTNQFHVIDMNHSFEANIKRPLIHIMYGYLKELSEIGLCDIIELKSIPSYDIYDFLDKNLYNLMNQYSSEYLYKKQIADLPKNLKKNLYVSMYKYGPELTREKDINNLPLLATTTYTYLKTLTGYNIDNEKVNALKIVDETLDKLISQYPPKKIHERWIEIADELHYKCNKIEQEIILTSLNNSFEATKNVRLELKRLCSYSYITRWLCQRIQYVIQAAKNTIIAPGDYVFGKNASIAKNAFNCTAGILFIFYASYFYIVFH